MSLSAVLLAGGESRRMRCDKATLEWRGRPLWKWQIEKLRAVGPERIFVSARSDPPWRPADVESILDIPPSRGPLGGLMATLAAIETDHLLVLAIDMPFMTIEHLCLLCSLVTKGMGVIPMLDEQAEPLSAIYPSEARAVFLETPQSDNFSVQPIVRKLLALNLLRESPVSGSDCRLYKSVNDPHDID